MAAKVIRGRWTAAVAEEIRALMGRRQVNQARLARQLGVSQTWVSYRTNGQVSPTVDELERIADALHVTLTDLLPVGAPEEVSRPTNREITRPADRRPPTRGHMRLIMPSAA